MKTLIIDGRDYSSPAEIQEYLQREMGFPDYYGKNLSALYDVLTEETAPWKVAIRLDGAEPEICGYLRKVYAVFEDAGECCPWLKVEWAKERP